MDLEKRIAVGTLLGLFPVLAWSQSYLCVPDAAAVVEDAPGRTATSEAFSSSDNKYVVTQAGGSWVVKTLGAEDVLFDSCAIGNTGVPTLCELGNGRYSGTFLLLADGRFAVVRFTSRSGSDLSAMLVEKGRCTSIAM